MKFTSFLILLVFLASCGTEQTLVEESKNTTPVEIVEETNTQIETELNNLEASSPSEENDTVTEKGSDEARTLDETIDSTEVVKVKAEYKNPKQEVYIDMEYTLDNAGKISSIQMTDSNYNQEGLDQKLQVLVGKSIDEIDDTYIAGGSLTIPAVKEALSGK